MDGTVSWINHWKVHSYPYEYPRVTFDEIKLDEGLWYTSAIESFISTSKCHHCFDASGAFVYELTER